MRMPFLLLKLWLCLKPAPTLPQQEYAALAPAPVASFEQQKEDAASSLEWLKK